MDTYGEFAKLAKSAYVDVANEDFVVPRRKKFSSRVAVQTNAHHHKVAKLLKRTATDSEDTYVTRHNRATGIIGGWSSDADFSEKYLPAP